jgi:hypothetical protein
VKAKGELVSQSWDIHPRIVDDEVELTFEIYLYQYKVMIPKEEIETFYQKLKEVV